MNYALYQLYMLIFGGRNGFTLIKTNNYCLDKRDNKILIEVGFPKGV